MQDISAQALLKPFTLLFKKFHFTLFILVIIAGLAGAVIVINTMLANLSTIDSEYTSSIGAGTIDQATLERIKSLHRSDEPLPAMSLPEGRTNPFGE